MFTYEGEPGDEIAQIYECSLRDARFYSPDEWDADEITPDSLITHKLAWKQLDIFRSGGQLHYPEGVLPLVSGR